jgi:hypothetical protein
MMVGRHSMTSGKPARRIDLQSPDKEISFPLCAEHQERRVLVISLRDDEVSHNNCV